VRLLAGVDHRDKTLLLGCAALVTILIPLLALFSPAHNDEDLTPSSYSTAPHGAKAAFELLRQSGYQVEWQSDSLAQIEDRVEDPGGGERGAGRLANKSAASGFHTYLSTTNSGELTTR